MTALPLCHNRVEWQDDDDAPCQLVLRLEKRGEMCPLSLFLSFITCHNMWQLTQIYQLHTSLGGGRREGHRAGAGSEACDMAPIFVAELDSSDNDNDDA